MNPDEIKTSNFSPVFNYTGPFIDKIGRHHRIVIEFPKEVFLGVVGLEINIAVYVYIALVGE